MKRFKKATCLYIALALIMSYISLGFGQVNVNAYSNYPSTGEFRVIIRTKDGTFPYYPEGSDSQFELRLLGASYQVLWQSGSLRTGGDDFEAGETNTFTPDNTPGLGDVNVSKDIEYYQLIEINHSDSWYMEWIEVYYLIESDWVLVGRYDYNTEFNGQGQNVEWPDTWSFSGHSHTLFFDTNGGTNTATYDAVYGQAIEAPLTSKQGYNFVRWVPSVPLLMPDTGITYIVQWTANNYTIYFDAQGGSVSPSSKTVTYMSPYGTLPTPARAGYTFGGWYTGTGGTGQLVTAASIANTLGNHTLYARWIINQYTVFFDEAGGSTVLDITLDYGTVITQPDDPAREGYTFDGWSPGVPATMPAEDTTCVAQWTINQYTITFEETGGSEVHDITQDYGTTVTMSEETVREGYTFSGWDPAVPAAMPVGGMTCTAQWSPNTYTVAYNGSGADSGVTANSSHTYGVFKALTINGFAKTGYTFAGWAETPGGSVEYTNGQSVLSLSPVNGATVMLYAVWYVNSYSIIFDANGGTGGTGPVSMEFGSVLAAPAVSRTGYTLLGWLPAVPPAVPAANTTYIAQWSINSYIITFNANGGTGSMSGFMIYGSTIPVPTVTRTGYTFTGWSPEAPTTVPAANTTFTAIWSANSYTVSYNGNGSTGGSMADSSHKYGMEKALTSNGYTKTGYTFSGWAASVFGPKIYDDAQLVSNLTAVDGATVTLYAVWSKIPVTLVVKPGSTAIINNSSNFIYGLEAGLNRPEFEESFIQITGNARLEYSSLLSNLGTNTKVYLVDNETGEVTATYTIVIFGDVNGDGNITGIDAGMLVNVENYMAAWDLIADAALIKAGDVNGDGNITGIDAGIVIDVENYARTINQVTGLAN